MIFDFWHSNRDSERRMFREMGYFGDQSGILRRYRREREHWEPHLQRTRQAALQAAQGKQHGSAAVLGSGWLLDVPVEELSDSFERVILFDVRHPAAAKKAVKQPERVELRVCDISEYAQPVYQYVKQYRNRKKRPPITDICPQSALDLSAFDFVFSCNILNQLDILLVDYLSRSFDLNPEEVEVFRRNVQSHHINMLPRGRSYVVADYEELTYDRKGNEPVCKPSVDHPIVQRADAERWIWEFDTRMTYYRGRKTYFKVFGAEL